MHKSIGPFYNQVDTEKLKKAIEYVGEMGNGTRVFYTQKVTHPHEQVVYIGIGMSRDTWNFTVHEYGHRYFPQMHQAISMVASEILKAVRTEEYSVIKIGDTVLTENQVMTLQVAINSFMLDLEYDSLQDEEITKRYKRVINEVWTLMGVIH